MKLRLIAQTVALSALLFAGCADADEEPSAVTSSAISDDSAFGTGDGPEFTSVVEAAKASDVTVYAEVGKPAGSYQEGSVDVSFINLKVLRSTDTGIAVPKKTIALAVPSDSGFNLMGGSRIVIFADLRTNVAGVSAVNKFLVVNGDLTGLLHVQSGRATAASERLSGLVETGESRLSAAVSDLWPIAVRASK